MYAAVAIVGIVMTEIDNKNLLTATFVQRSTGKKIKASYYVIFQVGIGHALACCACVHHGCVRST